MQSERMLVRKIFGLKADGRCSTRSEHASLRWSVTAVVTTTLLLLAQRQAGCRETGRPCGDPPACGCALEAAVEREDGAND